MMMILSIETCCGAYSICIQKDDEELYYFCSPEQNQQAEELVDEINRALRGLGIGYQDLDAIAATVGPGSFTGIRIGLAAIYGFAYGLAVKLISVTTLEALAYGMGDVDVALPAGRQRYYFQSFSNNLPVTKIQLKEVAEINLDKVYGFIDKQSKLPNARDVIKVALLKLAAGDWVEELEPLYVREADAVKSVK